MMRCYYDGIAEMPSRGARAMALVEQAELAALRGVADAARLCVEKIDRQGSDYPQDVVSDIWDWLTSALKPLERLKVSVHKGGG